MVADGEIKPGEPVLFTTAVPGRAVTRAEKSDAEKAFDTRMEAYKAVGEEYTFTVEMYEEGVAAALGSGTYQPASITTVTGEGESQVTTVTYPDDGELKSTATPLYWPGNAKKYGFRATAGLETMEGVLPSTEGATIKVVDQTTKAKLLSYDRLVGYGFEPIYDSRTTNTGTEEAPVNTENGPTDSETSLNYRTSKEWYQANVQTKGMAPGGQDAVAWYKKIPLYLQHQRSLVTIRLKAGEGVDRTALTYDHAVGDDTTEGHIETIVYSYAGGTYQEIQPLPQPATIDYGTEDEDRNVATTEYTCIVEPHDYLASATTEPIARINLSGQHFTFYASNDFLYPRYLENKTDAIDHMKGYNLMAGQHLVIEATLGRGSRKIVITAYVEDWTEAVTTSIVDDYGKSGEPIQINTRKELYEFLKDRNRNKPGNVAIIVPNSLDLEMSEGQALEWDYNEDNDETNDLDLWCTLNMAGATFRTSHQIFKNIHPMGNLVNGTVTVGSATVPAAIAEKSVGTLERITVLPRDANGNNSTGMASRAGLVISNSGTISQCSSELPVYGTYDSTEGSKNNLVGGIAAYSIYDTENGSTMPIIDGCTVNARVDGASGVQGAGIVGEAAGRVTNNTFVYGRTLLQAVDMFKNTIHHKGGTSAQTLRAYGNSWPTTANANGDGIPETNVNTTPEDERYTAVIDCQKELAALLDYNIDFIDHNNPTSIYRLSADFVVTKNESATGANDGWKYGQQDARVNNTSGSGNVYFKLDGNGHTITTDAMLFTNIMNDVSNLTIRLSDNLIATPQETGTSAIAPLAYSVHGGNGEEKVKISNIQVHGGNYRIQAATVGGVVVRALSGAVVENCQASATIRVFVKQLGDDQKIYSGGIVAIAAEATINRCIFHSTDGTLFRNTAEVYTDLSNEGDNDTRIFYGGILGGTAPMTDTAGKTENPSVLITDCTSWFSTSGNAQKGAVVGYAQYVEGLATTNGIAAGCQGNWWRTTANGIGTWLATGGVTIEDVIGKRNAVTPTQNVNY